MPAPAQSTAITPPSSPQRTATPPSKSQRTALPDSPAHSAGDPPRPPLDHHTRSILQTICRLHQGQELAPSLHARRFCVSPAQWEALRHAIFSSDRLGAWARDRLRYSYNPNAQLLVLQMPTALHDTFAVKLAALMETKLDALREADNIDDFVRMRLSSIERSGSHDIRLSRGKSRHSSEVGPTRQPDFSFRYIGEQRPPFVFEVAYSQPGDELPGIAEQYLCHTGGLIRTFLGVDVEYREPSQRADTSLPPIWAKYSLFRFNTHKAPNGKVIGSADTNGTVEFRGSNGQATDPASMLSIKLSDLVPRTRKNEGLARHSINVSHQELAHVLTMAEAAQDEVDNPNPDASDDSDALTSVDICEFRHKRKAGDLDEHASFEGSTDGLEEGQAEPRSVARRFKKRQAVSMAVIEAGNDTEEDTSLPLLS
jgi:hypothetical protein